MIDPVAALNDPQAPGRPPRPPRPPRPLRADVVDVLERAPFQIIDGHVAEPRTDDVIDNVDPSTGRVIGTIADGGAADVDRAVLAARDAFDTGPWRNEFSPSERQRCLLRLATLIDRDRELLAQIDALDCGRPYSLVLDGDLPAVIDHIEYFAGWPTKLTGQQIPTNHPDQHVHTVREPIGVVGLITPWNYPLLMAIWKIAPALAAGNCIVLKPAEEASLSALLIGQLAIEAGFPNGVFNVVTGRGEHAGAALVRHHLVDKISFTGSKGVAQNILEACSVDLKRVSLELGGKSPNIVLADADVDAATEGSLWAAFGNSGQSCTAGSRLYVHEQIHDQLVASLVARAEELSVGSSLSDPGPDLGPLVSSGQHKRVAQIVDEARDRGATVATGGQNPHGDDGESAGYFYAPTVLVDCRDDDPSSREEIFGPVVSVFSFASVDEVVRRANDTEYGLAAGVWTRDLSNAHRLAGRIRAGTVWVNSWGRTAAAVPFGGMRQSGHGREMGPEALELYTEVKSVWINYQ